LNDSLTPRAFFEGGRRPLTSREKELYHQIHPAKLATDIAVFPFSAYLIWMHQLILGVLGAFVPSIIASVVVVRYANLDKYVASPLGRYVGEYMTRTLEAVRLAGLVVSWAGAWYQIPGVIGLGILIVILAWLRGKIKPK
jgi:hypothetical protein